jgi:hypothetical protein
LPLGLQKGGLMWAGWRDLWGKWQNHAKSSLYFPFVDGGPQTSLHSPAFLISFYKFFSVFPFRLKLFGNSPPPSGALPLVKPIRQFSQKCNELPLSSIKGWWDHCCKFLT